jgi:hypothetical protein
MLGKIRFPGIFGIDFPRVVWADNQRSEYSVLYLKKVQSMQVEITFQTFRENR